MTPQPIREGDWFEVPLSDGRSALGLVARFNGKEEMLAYYFQPLSDGGIDRPNFSELGPGDAVLVGITGYLGLRKGNWRVVATSDPWDRTPWPMPAFKRYQELNDKTYRVIRDESTLAVVAETEVARDFSGPADESMRYGFVEARLSRLLAS